jgi:hypothetical protein
VAGFISEWWPASNRNAGRLQFGIGGRIASEFALAYEAADCSDGKPLTSDPLELARMKASLQKLRSARIAVQFALDSMQTPSDREISRAA